MRWLAALWRRPRGGPALSALGERFVAVDLETTGLDARADAIVALAAIPFVQRAVRPGLVTLVQPGRAIPATATAIHGITDAMTRGAPTTLDALRALEEACADDVLVGHGIGFDLAVIRRERRAHRLPPVGNPALDTMRLAAALYPAWRDVGLDAVAERLGVVIAGRHTPDGDAVAAGGILLRLLPTLATRGLRSLADVLWLQESVSLSGR